jgi:outer membrane cobalamin receptor
LLPLSQRPFSANPSAADIRVAALGETVVTATRNPTRTDELVSDVVVVNREAIEASTARTLPELLARTAGLQIQRQRRHRQERRRVHSRH